MLKAGDTFISVRVFGVPAHLWIIISDPTQDDRVIIVNINTFRQGSDQTCILRAGAHPFVRRKSYVNYRWARRVKRDRLSELLRTGKCKWRSPVRSTLLARVQQGAGTSAYMKKGYQRMLRDQGLIP